jgi:hypothetical protein
MSHTQIVLVARHKFQDRVSVMADLMKSNDAAVSAFLLWPEHEIGDVIHYILEQKANVVIADRDLCYFDGQRLINCLANLEQRLANLNFQTLLVVDMTGNMSDEEVFALMGLPFGASKH